MLKHYYSKEEINEIEKNLHNVLEFHKQFQKINLIEEEIMSNFLQGNFKPGSIEDPLLDCFGTAIFQYKFTNVVPKRINTMSNLPHIMNAEVVKPSDSTTIEGKFSSFTYEAKPSSKERGKAIVSGTWNRGEESFSFQYKTKIERASDKVLAEKFKPVALALDLLSRFNLTIEETDESKKGVYAITFAPAEVDTYGQDYEIESVEKEVKITDVESVKEMVQEISDNVGEYASLLSDIVEDKNTFYAITIVKGGKNDKSYLATEHPSFGNGVIQLNGNVTDEVAYISADGFKESIIHEIDEDDLADMSSVIYDDSVVLDDSEDEPQEEEADENEPMDAEPSDMMEAEVMEAEPTESDN